MTSLSSTQNPTYSNQNKSLPLTDQEQNKNGVLEKFNQDSVDIYNHNENVLYIVYFLTIIGLIVYFLNVKNMDGKGPIYMAIYLIILTIGAGAYHLLS